MSREGPFPSKPAPAAPHGGQGRRQRLHQLAGAGITAKLAQGFIGPQAPEPSRVVAALIWMPAQRAAAPVTPQLADAAGAAEAEFGAAALGKRLELAGFQGQGAAIEINQRPAAAAAALLVEGLLLALALLLQALTGDGVAACLAPAVLQQQGERQAGPQQAPKGRQAEQG